jgi:rRNA maturation endonuclease Nob1
MIYTCDNCLFIFHGGGGINSCPDCGKCAVRKATYNERNEYDLIQKEIALSWSVS